MNDRKKLEGLLGVVLTDALLEANCYPWINPEPQREAADYLMAAGVVLPVRCRDCKHFEPDPQMPDYFLCLRQIARRTFPGDYCSSGERRADDA